MSRRTARTEPVEAHRLTPSLTTCAACGQPMPVAYTKTRQLMTRRGLVRAARRTGAATTGATPALPLPQAPIDYLTNLEQAAGKLTLPS